MKGDYNFYKVKVNISAYERLKREHPELAKKLKYQNHIRFFSLLRQLVFQEMVNNVRGFSLPKRLGRVFIVGVKAKKRKGYVQNKEPFFSIAKTENYIFRIVWNFKKDNLFPNKELFVFSSPKYMQRDLFKAIKEEKHLKWTRVNNLSEILTTDV